MRYTLLKYHGLLLGSDLLNVTPEPTYDWLSPFRVAWLPKGFDEPELEEAAVMSSEERHESRKMRKKLGFGPV